MWTHFLSGFDYEIQYVKGGENNAYAFSRLPIKVSQKYNHLSIPIYILFRIEEF